MSIRRIRRELSHKESYVHVQENQVGNGLKKGVWLEGEERQEAEIQESRSVIQKQAERSKQQTDVER